MCFVEMRKWGSHYFFSPFFFNNHHTRSRDFLVLKLNYKRACNNKAKQNILLHKI